jgi:hypothetical protein
MLTDLVEYRFLKMDVEKNAFEAHPVMLGDPRGESEAGPLITNAVERSAPSCVPVEWHLIAGHSPRSTLHSADTLLHFFSKCAHQGRRSQYIASLVPLRLKHPQAKKLLPVSRSYFTECSADSTSSARPRQPRRTTPARTMPPPSNWPRKPWTSLESMATSHSPLARLFYATGA